MKLVAFILFFVVSCPHFQQPLIKSRELRDVASPDDPENYHIVDGGRINNLPQGSVVEGSVAHGGIRPDYIIDTKDPALQHLLKKARDISNNHPQFWNKTAQVVELVKQILPDGDYEDPEYLETVENFRNQAKDIPLSKYVCISAGVCREHSLILHLLLKEAGVPNTRFYAKANQRGFGYNTIEDHGFVVVNYRGEEWVIDSYNTNFNGFRLKDLLSPEGVTESSKMSPIATRKDTFRRLLSIHKYPRVWIPRSNETPCQESLKKIILIEQ